MSDTNRYKNSNEYGVIYNEILHFIVLIFNFFSASAIECEIALQKLITSLHKSGDLHSSKYTLETTDDLLEFESCGVKI